MKELLKELVRANTTAQSGELGAARIISDHFSRFGIESRIETWDENRGNVVARTNSSSPGAALLFACHLDVVGPGEGEWRYPPFSGHESDGRIHGRGSTDMKGGMAAIAGAICEVVASGVKLNGDIIFAALAGEETDSCGAKRFVRDHGQMSPLRGVVIPEPTDFEIVTAHRGMLWLDVTTRGTAAHGSTPELGINAISSMRAFLDELATYEIPFEPHKLLGRCSVSVNTISGGKTLNVVPDRCTVGIDIRTLPGQSHSGIIVGFQRILDRLKSADARFDAAVSTIREVGPLETDSGSAFVRDFCEAVGIQGTKAVGFTTDGPHLAALGAPVVIFGPGKPDICHKRDEYIEIADLKKAAEYYKKVIFRLLS
ncbi:MAG: M20 family metallopeptidase [Phycisphaerales bacterium]|nr:MAG: M20 family metallopeptidase [Phycisphaerales bacterium]